MKPQSPFQYNRWESDFDHLIWIPREFFEWNKKKSIYISGSRGTGKTTLLRAFTWKERIENESLKSQLADNPFSDRYIGVYLNMPNFIASHFKNWPPKKDYMDDSLWEEEKARVYSLYLECQMLQLFVGAIKGLRGNRILMFSPEDEEQYVEKILLERPELKHFIPSAKKHHRLDDLRMCFKSMHEKIRYCAINNTELYPNEYFPTLQMGDMLKEIVTILLDLCHENEKSCENKKNVSDRWTLKVCLDQVESPEHYQQKAINTMVGSLDNSDVSFAIASVSGSMDIVSTYIPNHPLTDSDRAHYVLDEIYSAEPSKFKDFIENVTELRFKKYTGLDDISVNLKEILGDWSINALLYPILKKSEKHEVREFLTKANKNAGIEFFNSKRKNLSMDQLLDEDHSNIFLSSEDEKKKSILIPPIYETYLVENLKLKSPYDNLTKAEIRSEKSSKIRKAKGTAILCLCKEFGGLEVPYAGYDMIVAMSDQSIRDYLLQMHFIYLEKNIAAKDFVKNKVPIRKQFKALLKASNARYNGIKNYVDYEAFELGKLVDSLGKITANIQSAYGVPSILTNEKGRFSIDFSLMESDDDKKRMKTLVKLAKDSFCIKVISETKDSEKIVFRLHNLFAPKFSYSYRGAYSNVKISGDDLLYLCTTDENKGEYEEKINKMSSQIIKVPNNKVTLDRWSANDLN